MSNEVGMPDLSPDIIVDILSRLPVKSVCRFRCVSKSWLHLTTEPHFIETHLNRTQRQKIILSSNNSLFSLDHEAPIDDDMLPVELDFPLKGEPCPRWVQMLGSCNGLVCIMPVPENIFIFNPSTGESMRVPDCPMPIQDGDPPVDFDVHSFGYAPSINDYKFIKITCGCFLFIFSLKNNSWKRLEDFPYKYLSDDSGTVLNRAVHWLCECPGGPCVIVAFDLAEEKFSELPPPESVTDHKKFTTGILRGCLCLLHQHDNWKRSFWVMKEYNVKESWTTIWITNSYFALKPLCYWKNTKILLARNRKQLLLCNPKDGTCKKLVANGLPVPFYAITYVESLVSPNFLSRTNGCI